MFLSIKPAGRGAATTEDEKRGESEQFQNRGCLAGIPVRLAAPKRSDGGGGQAGGMSCRAVAPQRRISQGRRAFLRSQPGSHSGAWILLVLPVLWLAGEFDYPAAGHKKPFASLAIAVMLTP